MPRGFMNVGIGVAGVRYTGPIFGVRNQLQVQGRLGTTISSAFSVPIT